MVRWMEEARYKQTLYTLDLFDSNDILVLARLSSSMSKKTGWCFWLRVTARQLFGAREMSYNVVGR